MNKSNFVGLVGWDPGINGGLAAISPRLNIKTYRVNLTNKELNALVLRFKGVPFFVEKIRPRPTNSLRSIIKSVQNWGRLDMSLGINDIDVRFVTPQQWQHRLGLSRNWDRPKSMTDDQFANYKYNERKKWHRDVATKMFPSLTVTHQNADALLIAHYGYLTLTE